MSVSLMIARRMRLRPDKGESTPPGIIIATMGIAISLVVMMLSVAVVTGFKHQIRDKITGFSSQVTLKIAPDNSERRTAGSEQAPDAISIAPWIQSAIPDGAEADLAAMATGVLKSDDAFTGVALKSLPADGTRGFIADNIEGGNIPATFATDSANVLILSHSTARQLGVGIGDRLFVHIFTGTGIKTRRMPVGAIYRTGFSDFDSRLAFTSLPFLQTALGLEPDQGTLIEVNGLPEDAIDNVAYEMQNALNLKALTDHTPIITVDSVHRSGALYFNWLSLLDTNVTVILILMACVAGFTLVSSTFIIILDRVAMIGILKTIGMTNAAIRRIFIYVGMRLVLVGLLIGDAVGLGLLFVQKWFAVIPLDPDAYYLDSVPVDINGWYIAALNAGVIIISALVLLMPTHAICRMSPSESVKYE